MVEDPGVSAQRAHTLAISAFSYSNDSNGIYPSGASSTAIFQMLYTQKYIQDAHDLFLTPNGGKSLASTSGPALNLKPENISWDFVTRANSGLIQGVDSDNLPLIISDVDTAPSWGSGENNATINSTNPLGTKGVTVARMDQTATFVKAGSVAGEVPLTTMDFEPAAGVTYLTRKP